MESSIAKDFFEKQLKINCFVFFGLTPGIFDSQPTRAGVFRRHKSGSDEAEAKELCSETALHL
jgi:hypothetical protein